MNKKYIFLDIDGTLFSPQLGRIPESAEEAVRQARANGSKVFLCTGRSLAGCNKYLTMAVDGFVFAAGAMVYADQKRIYDHPLAKDDKNLIKHIIHEEGMGYAAEGQAGGYCDSFGYDVLSRYFGGLTSSEEVQRARVSDNAFYPEFYEHPDEKIYKVCAYVQHGRDFDTLRRRLPEEFNLTVTVVIRTLMTAGKSQMRPSPRRPESPASWNTTVPGWKTPSASATVRMTFR